jgi:hypothetical protein
MCRCKLPVLTEKDVVFSLSCEPEQAAIEGNASAIDEETDRKYAAMIRRRLHAGNKWAWCAVKVTAKWRGFVGVDYLGCCSYNSEAQFRESGGYFIDMMTEALADLQRTVEDVHARLCEE